MKLAYSDCTFEVNFYSVYHDKPLTKLDATFSVIQDSGACIEVNNVLMNTTFFIICGQYVSFLSFWQLRALHVHNP